jgi:uracil-DNA glycosylase
MKVPINLKQLIDDPNTIPPEELVFRAFSYFKPEDTKVIIIGQDPYCNKEDACGLAFSIEHNNITPSLRNIFKELVSDVGVPKPKHGSLENWARQGVLLINSILTTKKSKSLAHENQGWEAWTKNKIQKIIDKGNPVVIMAWGKYAQGVTKELNLNANVLVLQGGHPSPLNRQKNFLGGKYFSKANVWLKEHNVEQIDWKL